MKRFALATAVMCFTTTVSAVNYLQLEKTAAEIACQASPDTCVPFTEPVAQGGGADIYKIDGRVMPPDALRDDAQQQQMLPANLYVKQDGSVAQLYEVDVEALKSQAAEKNTVLPFKNFDVPPAISGNDEKFIITTGEQQ